MTIDSQFDDSQITQRCSKCRIKKPCTEFNLRGGSEYGYRSQCKTCARPHLARQQRERRAKNPEKWKIYMDAYRITNREQILKVAMQSHYRRKFGLTIKERNEMLEEQGGVCAICQEDNSGSKKDWHVDHCHKTGYIRGILCAHCNTLLSRAKDDVTILQNAIIYLKRF